MLGRATSSADFGFRFVKSGGAASSGNGSAALLSITGAGSFPSGNGEGMPPSGNGAGEGAGGTTLRAFSLSISLAGAWAETGPGPSFGVIFGGR